MPHGWSIVQYVWFQKHICLIALIYLLDYAFLERSFFIFSYCVHLYVCIYVYCLLFM